MEIGKIKNAEGGILRAFLKKPRKNKQLSHFVRKKKRRGRDLNPQALAGTRSLRHCKFHKDFEVLSNLAQYQIMRPRHGPREPESALKDLWIVPGC
jgi:hypothetical protein